MFVAKMSKIVGKVLQMQMATGYLCASIMTAEKLAHLSI